MFSHHTCSQRNWSNDSCHAVAKYLSKFSKISLIFLCCLGCQTEPQPTCFEGVMMHVPYRVLIGEPLNDHQIERIEKIITQTFHHIDHVYNNWNPSSEISSLSRLSAQEKKDLSPELQIFLKKVDEFYWQSQGLFDVTISPLMKLWKQKKPSHEDLQNIASSTGWEKVHIQENYLWKDHSDISFDLCACSKGYTVDLLIHNLQNAGFHNLYVDWGGEISVRGHHSSGRSWKIGIHNQDMILTLNDRAIATSGDEYQTWTIDEIKYIHIINPKTKMPLMKKPGSISSVTVIAPTCLEADALATILMMFDSPDRAKDWLSKNYPETTCYFFKN